MNKIMIVLLFLAGIFSYYYFTKNKKARPIINTQLIPNAIYKITPASNFDKNNKDNCVKCSRIDLESDFIHIAFGYQVESVIKKFFKEYDELLLLELDIQILEQHGTLLRIEANKKGGEKFPHFYGVQKIPLAGVKNIIQFRK